MTRRRDQAMVPAVSSSACLEPSFRFSDTYPRARGLGEWTPPSTKNIKPRPAPPTSNQTFSAHRFHSLPFVPLFFQKSEPKENNPSTFISFPILLTISPRNSHSLARITSHNLYTTSIRLYYHLQVDKPTLRIQWLFQDTALIRSNSSSQKQHYFFGTAECVLRVRIGSFLSASIASWRLVALVRIRHENTSVHIRYRTPLSTLDGLLAIFRCQLL